MNPTTNTNTNISPFIRSFYTDTDPCSGTLDPKALFGEASNGDELYLQSSSSLGRTIKIAPPIRRTHTSRRPIDENNKPLNRSAKISQEKSGQEKDAVVVKNVLDEILNDICINELSKKPKTDIKIKSILKNNFRDNLNHPENNLVQSKKEVHWNSDVMAPMSKKKMLSFQPGIVPDNNFINLNTHNSIESLDPDIRSAFFY